MSMRNKAKKLLQKTDVDKLPSLPHVLLPLLKICHDESIVVQQQLSRAAWAKTVDKMTGLGAPVAPGDRDALIDYLSSRFPPLSDKD